ncbi:MAG: FAD-dependent oxidoreductase, partial [Planctomycetota bacterium]
MHSLFHDRRHLIPFRSALLPQIFTDVLVIGSGVAGLRTALAAAEHSEVVLLSKGGRDAAATAWAQGGIAAALHRDDAPQLHARDTLAAGAGLCDAPAVERITREGVERVGELLEWGFAVDRDAEGEPALAREGGHSRPRILHAGGDATGAALLDTLWRRLELTAGERVRVFDNCFALDLLTAGDEPGAPCVGAVTHHRRYGLQIIWARATILAGGGAGMAWRETTNPPSCTGDALAMAYRAGAQLADMAFMQFHPTTLYIAGAAR